MVAKKKRRGQHRLKKTAHEYGQDYQRLKQKELNTHGTFGRGLVIRASLLSRAAEAIDDAVHAGHEVFDQDDVQRAYTRAGERWLEVARKANTQGGRTKAKRLADEYIRKATL